MFAASEKFLSEGEICGNAPHSILFRSGTDVTFFLSGTISARQNIMKQTVSERGVLMQNEWWMRPALQKSEAVLLPALPRSQGRRFSDYFLHSRQETDAFRPVADAGQATALSTYVRPRGSMAGRSVLRAAGVRMSPYRQGFSGVRAHYLRRPLRTF